MLVELFLRKLIFFESCLSLFFNFGDNLTFQNQSFEWDSVFFFGFAILWHLKTISSPKCTETFNARYLLTRQHHLLPHVSWRGIQRFCEAEILRRFSTEIQVGEIPYFTQH